MTQEKPVKKARFIKPPNKLKMKVGSGGIKESLIEEGQDAINHSDHDFLPYARKFLKNLSTIIEQAKQSNDNFEPDREEVIKPIMQLKASGGMFRYQLVSDVADIALQFLENIKKVDKDAIDVLIAHEDTIKVIINNNLKGDGGKEGYALVQELDQACKRYFKKNNIKY